MIGSMVDIRQIEKQIADCIWQILNETLVVETVNEAALVKLFELRGTPLTPKRCLRDIEHDWRVYQEDQQL